MANDTTGPAGGTATAAVAVAGPGGKEPGRTAVDVANAA